MSTTKEEALSLLEAKYQEVKAAIENAYTSCSNKNATMPEERKLSNLSSCIDSIIAAVLQTSTSVNPTESKQIIKPGDGYNGLSQVIVNAISSAYIGSAVTKKGSAIYTPSKETQTISSGQYLTGTQTINPIPDEYIIPKLQAKTQAPLSTGSVNVKPDSGYDGLSQVTVGMIPTSYIIPSGTNEIYTNGKHDVKQYENAVVDVKHFASGNKSLSAGQDPVTVSGITDQNGKSFTPVGFCFMLHPTKPTNFVGSTYYLVSAVYHNRECSRIVAWNQNASNATAYYSVRANPSVPSIGSSGVTLSNGKFSLHVGSDAYKPIAGRYMWVAWG